MMSLSNLASAPKMWKMSFSPDVVVSIASVIDLKPIRRSLSPFIVSMEMCQGAAKPVQPPDDQRVALTEMAQGFVKANALGFGAGCRVGEDALASGLLQSVFLKIKGLVCC